MVLKSGLLLVLYPCSFGDFICNTELPIILMTLTKMPPEFQPPLVLVVLGVYQGAPLRTPSQERDSLASPMAGRGPKLSHDHTSRTWIGASTPVRHDDLACKQWVFWVI